MAEYRPSRQGLPASSRALNRVLPSGTLVLPVEINKDLVQEALEKTERNDQLSLLYAGDATAFPKRVNPIDEQDRRENHQYHQLENELAYRFRPYRPTRSARQAARHRPVKHAISPGAGPREPSSILTATSLSILTRPTISVVAGEQPVRTAQRIQASIHRQIEIVGPIYSPDSQENEGGTALVIHQGLGTRVNDSDDIIFGGEFIEGYMPLGTALKSGASGQLLESSKSGERTTLRAGAFRPEHYDMYHVDNYYDSMARLRALYFTAPDGAGGRRPPTDADDPAHFQATPALLAQNMEPNLLDETWRLLLVADAYARMYIDTNNEIAAGGAPPQLVAGADAGVNADVRAWGLTPAAGRIAAFDKLGQEGKNLVLGGLLLAMARDPALCPEGWKRDKMPPNVWTHIYGSRIRAFQNLSYESYSRVFGKSINTALPGEEYDYHSFHHGYA
jgi:hypothetical protein